MIIRCEENPLPDYEHMRLTIDTCIIYYLRRTHKSLIAFVHNNGILIVNFNVLSYSSKYFCINFCTEYLFTVLTVLLFIFFDIHIYLYINKLSLTLLNIDLFIYKLIIKLNIFYINISIINFL